MEYMSKSYTFYILLALQSTAKVSYFILAALLLFGALLHSVTTQAERHFCSLFVQKTKTNKMDF